METRGGHERKGGWEGERKRGRTEYEEEEGEGVCGDGVVVRREGQGADVVGAWGASNGREGEREER